MRDAEHDAGEPELHDTLVKLLCRRRQQGIELDGMGLCD